MTKAYLLYNDLKTSQNTTIKKDKERKIVRNWERIVNLYTNSDDPIRDRILTWACRDYRHAHVGNTQMGMWDIPTWACG